MSRLPKEDESKKTSPEYDVRDILAEYWEQATGEEESAPAVRRCASRASLAAVPEEEQAEAVRIYRPRKEKAKEGARLAARWGEAPAEKPEAPRDEPERPSMAEPEAEGPAEAAAREKPDFLRSARELAAGFLSRIRGEKAAAPARELPSFDELVWGKKEEPVRIVEEEEESPLPQQEKPRREKSPEAPPMERTPELPRRQKPQEVEVHIPEEELTGMSVNAILAEYWGGLEEEPIPLRETRIDPRETSAILRLDDDPTQLGPLQESRDPERSAVQPSTEKTRLYRRQPQAKEKAPGKEKTRLFRLPFAAPEKASEEPGAAPQEKTRLFSRQPRTEEKTPGKEKTRIFRLPFTAPEKESPAEPEAAPAPKAETAPKPPRQPAPAPKPTADDDAEVLNLSVDDILSEFRAGSAEPEEPPASPAGAPRSRREAARMREEEAPVPPTGAAPSAADNKFASPRRESRLEEKKRPAQQTDRASHPARSAGKGAARPARQERRPARRESRREERRASRGDSSGQDRSDADDRNRWERPNSPEPVEEELSSPPPPPLKPEEPAALFGFLRKDRKDKPEPAPAAPPAPPKKRREEVPRTASPREKTDEDVEIGAMSVDEILAEYNDIFAALPAAAEAIGAERDAEAARKARPARASEAPEKPRPAPQPAPPLAEKPRSDRGKVSRMEEEAQDFLRQMRSESFGAHREEPRPQGGLRRSRHEAPAEPAAPAPEKEPEPAGNAPAPMPSVADAEWSASLRRLLGQDPAPPQPVTEPSSQEGAELQPSPRPAKGVSIPSDVVDPRFNLSGERRTTMVFGGRELDTSADTDYVPPKASDKVGFHWVAGEEELPGKPLQKQPLFRRPRKEKEASPEEEKEHTEGYDDRKKPEYAPDKDYDEDDEADDPGAFPSFGQYLSGLISRGLVRLFGARRTGADGAGTMEDADEDLGPEVSPAAASKYYGSFVPGLRKRVRIGLILLAVMAWITLGLPVTGALRTVQVASGLVLAMQLTMLLLGLDVVTGAAVNLARGRFGADSLAVLCCVLTSLDALSVALGFMGTPNMPLCLISSISLLGVMLSSLASARGLRKALRVPAIGKRCYGVTAEAEVKGSGLTLLKSLRPPKGFVRRAEESAPDEDAFARLAPLLAVLCLLFALVVALAKHAFSEFLYILTALLCPAVPLMALLCFALPYLFGSLRIFHSGAAIAGWSGISDIGISENLIVTDRDLFPEGSVEIDTVRIFAEVQPELVISYAGTMVCASGSDLAPCFAQLMEKNNCPMRRVEGFEYLPGGGMKGVIDGSVVLCGGLDLMRLMTVRVPYRLVGKTTVLLAVDGILCGIFNMKYEGQPQVRKALVGLIRSNRHPIFAIRDFLVTPDMLSDCFEVATDGYDFPPYVDRFAISEAKPSADSKLAAVVCREGLGPLVHMADTGRSMYLAVRLNLLITALAAVLGVFTVFIKLLSAGTVTMVFLLVFLLVWALPVLLISLFMRL